MERTTPLRTLDDSSSIECTSPLTLVNICKSNLNTPLKRLLTDCIGIGNLNKDDLSFCKTGSLVAKGRITEVVYDHLIGRGLITKCNKPQKIDGVKLDSYDQDERTITVRMDHSECLSFWIEIVVSLDRLEEWINFYNDGDYDKIEEISSLTAKGRITELDYSKLRPTAICNKSQKIDGVKLNTYDEDRRVFTIRLDHSEIPSFWAEIEIPVDQLKKWMGYHLD